MSAPASNVIAFTPRPRIAWSLREAYDEELQDGASLRNFVLQSWLRSYVREWPGWAALCEPAGAAAYWQSHQAGVKVALRRSRAILAHDPGDHDIVYGYVVVEDDPRGAVLHYLYVKDAFRRRGCAAALWEAAGRPVRASHRAFEHLPWLRAIAARAGIAYDPVLLWRRP